MTETITWKMWAYLNSVWTDITEDVIQGTIKGGWGIKSVSPFERVAGTGTMYFDLDNSTKKYSPASGTVLSGWDVGVKIKWVITYDGIDFVKFYGRISADARIPGIVLTTGVLGERRAKITVLDWMDNAAKAPIISQGIATDITAGTAIDTLVLGMELQPLASDYDMGDVTFPNMFDAASIKSKIRDELVKITLSEMGYTYLKKDKTYGETLVFEANSARSGTITVGSVPVSGTATGKLKIETNDYLLLETGDKLLLNETQTASFVDTMLSSSVTYGQNTVNRITVTVYPRDVDTSDQTLFSLVFPISVSVGETKTFRTNYTDPTGGGRMVNADTNQMIAPGTADYSFNTAQDGSGTDLSSYLTLSAAYGVEGVTYTMYNTSGTSGWVTSLQARGRGIYINNPIESAVEDLTSIDNYGYQVESIQQRYSQDTSLGQTEAYKVMARDKYPRTRLEKATFNANTNSLMMNSFLYLDVGDFVTIGESQTGINANQYINAVEFEELTGNIINFTWTFVNAPFGLGSGLTAVGFQPTSGGAGVIDFGNIPYIQNLSKISFSFWMYLNTSFTATLFTMGDKIIFYGPYIFGRTYTGNSPIAKWQIGSGYSTGQWYHVVLTHDISVNDKADPVAYTNGTAQTISISVAPSGTLINTLGANFQIGSDSGFSIFSQPAKIFDFRIYNNILTSSEVLTIYNGGTPSSTVGIDSSCVFRAFSVPTEKYSTIINRSLTTSDIITDSLRFIGGVSRGGGTIIAAP